MVYTHVKLFAVTVKNLNYEKVTCHCWKVQLSRADLSLFLNVPVLIVKWEIFLNVSETAAAFFRVIPNKACN